MPAKDMRKTIWLLSGAVLISFLLSMKTPSFPLSHRIDFNDSAIYKYIGYLLLKGKTPYVDVFDHKGIYFYFISALGCWINMKWGMWLLTWFLVLGTMILIYRTSILFLDKQKSVFISLLLGVSISANYWMGDIPDSYGLFLSILSFYLLSEFFLTEDISRWRILGVGLASGLTFWIKFNLMFGSIILCGFIILFMLASKKFALIIRCCVFFTIGFVLASLPALGWLWSRHALAAMVEDYFFYNSNYISFYAVWDQRLFAFSYFITRPEVLFSVLVFLSALLSVLLKKQLQISLDKMLLCGAATFAVCMIQAVMPGNLYEHYTLLLYPGIIFLLVASVRLLEMAWLPKKRRLEIVLGVSVCVVIIFNCIKIINYCSYFWTKPIQEDEEITFILDHTDENDTIQLVTPQYCGYYLSSGHESASKYVYVQSNHFWNMKNHPEKEEVFWNEYIQDIQDKAPRMLLFDREYVEQYEAVKEKLLQGLDRYQFAGKSALFEFYILPRDGEETIPQFESEYEIPDKEPNSVSFEISQDMIDAYQRGEITIDDFMAAFDEAMKEK